MKKFFVQAVILIIVAFTALFYAFPGGNFRALTGQSTQPAPKRKQTQVIIKNTAINVELADTKEKRSKGLGGRQSLASDAGMLFLFDKKGTYPFWMKGLSFPLDLIWISGNTVVDIIKNATVPVPGQSDQSLPRYVSNQPVDRVLEVNAGFVDSHNIQIGDSIEVK